MPYAAREGDPVTGTDTHLVLVPGPGGAPTPVPQPLPFNGTLDSGLSPDVLIDGRRAAVTGSGAVNRPGHLPAPPGTGFTTPPTDRGTVLSGSATVLVNGSGLARLGDPVATCCDVPGPPATITGGSPGVVAG
ncbi:PAAR domain-containing protein [Actinoplanes sp. NPDC049265]|uniref:PAAR domain-containing protein n=1 Tax=Actinoplanes sp. NPDC049265 TaxID=3363902 RepID=UPI003719F0A5